MKLERMSLRELGKFCDDLHALQIAGERLETAGLTPEFDLSSQRTLIRLPALFAAGDPGPVVIEPAPGVPFAPPAPWPTTPPGPFVTMVSGDSEPVAPTPVPGTGFAALHQPLVQSDGTPWAWVETAEPKHAESAPLSPQPYGQGEDGMKRGPWSPEEDQALYDGRAAGRTWQQIADGLGRPVSAVSKRLYELNKAQGTATKRVNSVGKDGLQRGPWSPTERKLLIAMRAEGKTFAQIGQRLSRPESACRTYYLERIAPELRAKSEPDAGPEAQQGAPVETGPAAEAVAPPAPEPAGAVGSAAPAPEPPPPVVQHIRRPAPPVVAPPDLSGEARRLFLAMAESPCAARWGVGDDLALVEGLAKGRKLAEVALDLGFDAADAKARFQALAAPVADDRGRLTLDGQKHLLAALRALAAARGVAA